MSKDVNLKEIEASVQTLGIVLALVTSAMAQPSLDRAAFIESVEKTLDNLKKAAYDDTLLETVRITLLPFKLQLKPQ